MEELVRQIESAWMEYNAAVVSRLHIKETKQALANMMINATEDILKALRAYRAPAEEKEEKPSSRKNRKTDEKSVVTDNGVGQE